MINRLDPEEKNKFTRSSQFASLKATLYAEQIKMQGKLSTPEKSSKASKTVPSHGDRNNSIDEIKRSPGKSNFASLNSTIFLNNDDNSSEISPVRRRGRPRKIVEETKNMDGNDLDNSIDNSKINELSNSLAQVSLLSEAWYASPDVYFPPEFTHRTLTEMARYDSSSDSFIWARNTYSSSSWREKALEWDRKYPNLVVIRGKEKGTPHETMSFRTRQTTLEENIQWCWDSLSQTHADISSKFRSVFRVDMYGNVVSINASDGALCKFDVDHLFPWSRGGRSVRGNFAAVQCDANRRVKNDCLIPLLSPENMLAGISPRQFKSLMDYAAERGGKGQRRNIKYEQDIVVNWLTHGPRKGFSISNFQKLVNGTTDGETLWNFFEGHNAREKAASTPQKKKEAAEEKKEEELIIEEPVVTNNNNAESLRRVPAKPIANIRLTPTMVECFGSPCYQLRSKLKNDMNMSFDNDPDRKCWFKYLPNRDEQQQFTDTLRAMFNEVGCSVMFI